jgi:hypothetical protein
MVDDDDDDGLLDNPMGISLLLRNALIACCAFETEADSFCIYDITEAKLLDDDVVSVPLLHINIQTIHKKKKEE